MRPEGLGAGVLIDGRAPSALRGTVPRYVTLCGIISAGILWYSPWVDQQWWDLLFYLYFCTFLDVNLVPGTAALHSRVLWYKHSRGAGDGNGTGRRESSELPKILCTVDHVTNFYKVECGCIIRNYWKVSAATCSIVSYRYELDHSLVPQILEGRQLRKIRDRQCDRQHGQSCTGKVTRPRDPIANTGLGWKTNDGQISKQESPPFVHLSLHQDRT